MRTKSTIALSTLLGLVNGYFLGVWRTEWMNTNDVGRQWIRLIIPGMMLVISIGIIVVVWVTDKFTGKKTRASNQASEAIAPPVGAQPQR